MATTNGAPALSIENLVEQDRQHCTYSVRPEGGSPPPGDDDESSGVVKANQANVNDMKSKWNAKDTKLRSIEDDVRDRFRAKHGYIVSPRSNGGRNGTGGGMPVSASVSGITAVTAVSSATPIADKTLSPEEEDRLKQERIRIAMEKKRRMMAAVKERTSMRRDSETRGSISEGVSSSSHKPMSALKDRFNQKAAVSVEQQLAARKKANQEKQKRELARLREEQERKKAAREKALQEAKERAEREKAEKEEAERRQRQAAEEALAKKAEERRAATLAASKEAPAESEEMRGDEDDEVIPEDEQEFVEEDEQEFIEEGETLLEADVDEEAVAGEGEDTGLVEEVEGEEVDGEEVDGEEVDEEEEEMDEDEALQAALECSIFDLIKEDNLEAIDLLTEHDPELLRVIDEQYGATPLHFAAGWGSPEMMRRIIAAKADLHHKSQNDYSPLHTAASRGRHEAVEILIEAGTVVNMRGKGGYTSLHVAAERNHVQTVQCLVDANASPSIKGEDGMTALDLALGKGNQEIVDILTAHAAKKNSSGARQAASPKSPRNKGPLSLSRAQIKARQASHDNEAKMAIHALMGGTPTPPYTPSHAAAGGGAHNHAQSHGAAPAHHDDGELTSQSDIGSTTDIGDGSDSEEGTASAVQYSSDEDEMHGQFSYHPLFTPSNGGASVRGLGIANHTSPRIDAGLFDGRGADSSTSSSSKHRYGLIPKRMPSRTNTGGSNGHNSGGGSGGPNSHHPHSYHAHSHSLATSSTSRQHLVGGHGHSHHSHSSSASAGNSRRGSGLSAEENAVAARGRGSSGAQPLNKGVLGVGAAFEQVLDAESKEQFEAKKKMFFANARRGVRFRKHGRRGAPHDRVVKIKDDLITWKKGKDISIQEIIKVVHGKHSRVFKRSTAAGVPAEMCFTVYTTDSTRCLDLQASSGAVRNEWVKWLSWAAAQANSMPELH